MPVDQVVQMVGALREHLLNAAPGGGGGATAAKAPHRKRRNAKAATAADEAGEAVTQVSQCSHILDQPRCLQQCSVQCHDAVACMLRGS